MVIPLPKVKGVIKTGLTGRTVENDDENTVSVTGQTGSCWVGIACFDALPAEAE